MRKLLALSALMVSCSSIAQTDDESSALEVHNLERISLGIEPLKWSNNLTVAAKKYADYLASKDLFIHSNNLESQGQGENLYATKYYMIDEDGAKYFYDETNYLADASIAWLDEKKDFRYAKIGSRKNNFDLIGHYTQMIWTKSREVGIAFSKSKSGNVYVVARYYPSGNWEGEYPY
jgi:hypothetical protein